MHLTEAVEINQALVGCFAYANGIRSHLPDIGQWTLPELLEASRVLKHPDVVTTGNKHHVVCDDRLIAALYVWRHCDAHPDPIMDGDGRALVCLESHE